MRRSQVVDLASQALLGVTWQSHVKSFSTFHQRFCDLPVAASRIAVVLSNPNPNKVVRVEEVRRRATRKWLVWLLQALLAKNDRGSAATRFTEDDVER